MIAKQVRRATSARVRQEKNILDDHCAEVHREMCVALKVSLQVGSVLRFRQSGAGLIMFSLGMSADIFPWIRQHDVDKREGRRSRNRPVGPTHCAPPHVHENKRQERCEYFSIDAIKGRSPVTALRKQRYNNSKSFKHRLQINP